MEKGEEKEAEKAHCLILPFPIQGHINPMLQFAKRLLQKGIIGITLVITKQLAKTTHYSSAAISLQTISDGFDDGAPTDINQADYLARFEEVGSTTLKEAMQGLADSGRPVDCVIFDPFLPWALQVAKELAVFAAAFFTQSCAVDHIYHHVYKGELKVPLLPGDQEILIPGLPPLRPDDMPSFVSSYGTYPPLFEVVVNQFTGLDKADWLFFNTFYNLEKEVIDYMAKSAPVKAIGPTIPSMYLDKRLPDDREYGLSVYKAVTGACTEWLNQRRPESVIYVSFGSLAKLDDRQMEELAWGLRLSNKHFLWVVRATEESKLPKDFAEETSEKGLIVSWCPQLDVLSHEAICCFVTHCGWNSTLESVSLGVPMVAMPQWTDQSTNSKFVMDVWKMGVRARGDENGLVSRETVASCIMEVVEGERAVEIKQNVIKWKELAIQAMAQGGSSDLNIQEFVTSLTS
ncbi:hypothetical protein C2S53_001178 [Perilla frutescens var. hirtella]|uniref:Glycosyltransferase n=1 Tax=Perilla frutescens var. hirtella TaxID=608512 RepID=A0AAD4JM04_PERFH|nr:hypothetical protein C2S53_001178 [Perilla frutescens var. hirtella]